MEGRKDDSGKIRWSLLPLRPLRRVVEVLEFGAQKYAPNNWMRVKDPLERYADAGLRHVFAWMEGERNDPESGLHHLAHAICCFLFALWFEEKEEAEWLTRAEEQIRSAEAQKCLSEIEGLKP